MVVDHWADPVPGQGQVLVEIIACGICGSDLHTVDHAADMASAAHQAGIDTFGFDPDHDLVMGHELSVRVLELGPATPAAAPVAVGAAMAAMPSLTTPNGRVVPGYDNTYPGGYAERMLLDPGALLPVPNGLDPALAALTEPMAVGLHAVNQSAVAAGRGAIVVGAGPVGLAVVAALSLAGAEPIVASDFSPRRRALAAELGAHAVVDPPAGLDAHAGFAAAVETWAELRSGDVAPVVFEAVGVPGMIDVAMTGAPPQSEIVVVGVCMQADRFRPIMGIYKHLTVRFVLGWSPVEFAQSLHNLAEGRIPAGSLVTDQVDLEGVPAAFTALAHPDRHVKILVRPNGS
jgi:threonine dehydrogenase-like Zn-dependent dehydrogenase